MSLHLTGTDLAAVLLLGLAVHRAWRILAVDEMPWLVRARTRVTGTHAPLFAGGPYRVERPVLAKWLECPWCCGAWLTVGGYALLRWAPGVGVPLVLMLAASSICGTWARNLDPTED